MKDNSPTENQFEFNNQANLTSKDVFLSSEIHTSCSTESIAVWANNSKSWDKIYLFLILIIHFRSGSVRFLVSTISRALLLMRIDETIAYNISQRKEFPRINMIAINYVHLLLVVSLHEFFILGLLFRRFSFIWSLFLLQTGFWTKSLSAPRMQLITHFHEVAVFLLFTGSH